MDGLSDDTNTFNLTRVSSEDGEDKADDAQSRTHTLHASESAGSVAETAAANAAAAAVARGSPTAAERRAAKERERAHQQLLAPLSGEVMARVLDGRGMQDVDMIRQKRFQKRLTPNLYRYHPEGALGRPPPALCHASPRDHSITVPHIQPTIIPSDQHLPPSTGRDRENPPRPARST